jgi:DNA mismatch repair ATPase MutS
MTTKRRSKKDVSKNTKNQKSDLAQKITLLKGKYKNSILFLVLDGNLEAFFNDALLASGLCGFPLLRDIRCGAIVPYVSVSLSQLDEGVPVMLAKGFKVLVVGSNTMTIHQKS